MDPGIKTVAITQFAQRITPAGGDDTLPGSQEIRTGGHRGNFGVRTRLPRFLPRLDRGFNWTVSDLPPDETNEKTFCERVFWTSLDYDG